MELSLVGAALLAVTLVLHTGHVGIHVWTTLVRKATELPSYDATVGYLGALTWFIMILEDRGTLGWEPWPLVMAAGFVTTGVGLYIHWKGLKGLRAHRGEGGLITDGIFERLRHPIYYSWVVVSFGMPLFVGSLVGLVTAPYWSAIILAVGRLEETDLRRRYPDGEYARYLEGTWF